jgi:hypothetical protein
MDVDLRLRGRTRPWSACSLIFVDQASEDLAAFDPADRQADTSAPSAGARRSQDVNEPGPDLDHEEHVQAPQQHSVDREEVTRQRAARVGTDEITPSARRGAGPRPTRFRIRRIVAPLIPCPRFFSSPRSVLHGQAGHDHQRGRHAHDVEQDQRLSRTRSDAGPRDRVRVERQRWLHVVPARDLQVHQINRASPGRSSVGLGGDGRGARRWRPDPRVWWRR